MLVEIDHAESATFHESNVVRSETEMNMNWATNHPELFVASVKKFQTRHPAEVWDHEIDLSRDCYVTLIAKRKEK